MSNFGRTGGGGAFGLPSVHRARIPVTEDPERQVKVRQEFSERLQAAEKFQVGDKITCPIGKKKVAGVTRHGTIEVKNALGRIVTYPPSAITRGWD